VSRREFDGFMFISLSSTPFGHESWVIVPTVMLSMSFLMAFDMTVRFWAFATTAGIVTEAHFDEERGAEDYGIAGRCIV